MGSPPPGGGPGSPPPLHPQYSPLVAPDHPPPGMGHQRPTGFAATPPPAHGKGKGQREGLRQRGDKSPISTGRRPQGQGTGGYTTRGQGSTGGPPTREKRKARGHGTWGEGATMGTRTHITKEGHTTLEEPAPPHPPYPIDTARPRRDKANQTHQADHPAGARAPRRAPAART